jgi:SAM-dependent methyltransferase
MSGDRLRYHASLAFPSPLQASDRPVKTTLVPTPSIPGGFRELDKNRCGFAEYFASLIAQEPRLSGCVLDVGCGAEGPTTVDHKDQNLFRPLLARAAQLDGLDPGPDIQHHASLTNRWQSTLEAAPIPEKTYDLIVSFNVLEHVGDTKAFMAALYRALKPGGVSWAMTPHGNHPFAWCVHLVEALNVKAKVGGDYKGLNKIPTYYRLNSRKAITRAAEEAGFSAVTFYFYPALQWELYFPKALRFVPRLYDWLIGARFQSCYQQMLVKFER